MEPTARRDLNWNFLEYFFVVAENLSIKDAAKQLGIASSTVSEGIQALERQFHLQLLARHTRKIELTTQGKHLYERIRPVFSSQTGIFESLTQP